MNKWMFAGVFLIFLAACQPSAPAATYTPAPSPTPTLPPTGISGSIAYTGSSNGSLLIFALDHAPAQNENPAPVAIETYDANGGNFLWELPAGTYFITAFLTIDREPQGPPLPNEPLVFCDPVSVNLNQTAQISITLTDKDAGGSNASCLIGN